jgi:N-methylhydantoinase B
LKRDVEAVLKDVALGYYTRDQAESLFGVAIDVATDAYNAERTAELRSRFKPAA